jgi:hypothetical protein
MIKRCLDPLATATADAVAGLAGQGTDNREHDAIEGGYL